MQTSVRIIVPKCHYIRKNVFILKNASPSTHTSAYTRASARQAPNRCVSREAPGRTLGLLFSSQPNNKEAHFEEGLYWHGGVHRSTTGVVEVATGGNTPLQLNFRHPLPGDFVLEGCQLGHPRACLTALVHALHAQHPGPLSRGQCSKSSTTTPPTVYSYCIYYLIQPILRTKPRSSVSVRKNISLDS